MRRRAQLACSGEGATGSGPATRSADHPDAAWVPAGPAHYAEGHSEAPGNDHTAPGKHRDRDRYMKLVEG
ncbi:hypothetical protein [Streptomyces sp. AA1529]|uniref:hypothetical protein n=1 Tax=Streptomyces sp. AA1529 TaxID=1203257 RepID=UPI003D711A3D